MPSKRTFGLIGVELEVETSILVSTRFRVVLLTLECTVDYFPSSCFNNDRLELELSILTAAEHGNDVMETVSIH